MNKARYLSYPVGMRVRIRPESSWYMHLQKGCITSVEKEGKTFRYTVSGCAWVFHHDLTPRKKQPPTLGQNYEQT